MRIWPASDWPCSRFNGAAPVEGRKAPFFSACVIHHDCFNGAAPVEGRKAGLWDRVANGYQGFNGAAPVEGRKVPLVHDLPLRLSTLQWGRPCGGAESRRNTSRRSKRTARFNGAAPVEGRKAACGRFRLTSSSISFNGAAPVEGRKVDATCRHACSVKLLQWGRPCGGAESPRACNCRNFSTAASMGPPLWRGGKPGSRRCRLDHLEASMGPPLWRGGKAMNRRRGR